MTAASTVTFLGAAGTTTGSKHLLRHGKRNVLLDCGLFAGLRELRERNWDKPAFPPGSLDAVVLSHAHVDHSAYLPVITRLGFRGPVWCTTGTADLLDVVLPDSARLQEEDAEQANKHGYSKHKPARPLCTEEDARRALKLVRGRGYDTDVSVCAGITATFRRTGHILGSASVDLKLDGPTPLRLVFSGDLGRWNKPILRDPEFVPEADVLLVESTYGDRTHPPDPGDTVARIVNEGVARGGAIIIPAFAVDRTQELLYVLRELEDRNRIPRLPVYVDSPMATAVTDLYCRHPEDHDLEMTALMDRDANPLESHTVRFVRTPDESKAVNKIDGPFVLIASSGMATGGRVLHHLKHRLGDPKTTVMLVGYQAVGTRGRALQEGSNEVHIHGQRVFVRATVEKVDGLSAHADREEILKWLGGFRRPPRVTYLVHGEPPAAIALQELIRQRLGWDVRIPTDGETVSLAPG
jgi:metallo-beta-lactamase family protein